MPRCAIWPTICAGISRGSRSPRGARPSSTAPENSPGRNRWRLAAALAIVAALAAAARHELEVYGRDQRLEAELRQLDQASVGRDTRGGGQAAWIEQGPAHDRRHARQSLNRLWAEWPDSRETQRTLAEAYIQFANVQGEPFAISLGDNAGALEELPQGRGAGREAQRLEAGGRSRAGAGATGNRRDGDSRRPLRRSGRHGAGGAWMRRAGFWESGARIEVEDVRQVFMYVRMHVLLGHAMMRAAEWNRNAGQARQALDEFRQAVSLATEARRRDPGMPDLAARYSEYVGYGLETLSELTGDRQYLEEAIPPLSGPSRPAARNSPRRRRPRRSGTSLTR